MLRKQNVTDTWSDGRSVGRSDNVKTVYPPTNTVCGGIKNKLRCVLFFFRTITVIRMPEFYRITPALFVTEKVKRKYSYGWM